MQLCVRFVSEYHMGDTRDHRQGDQGTQNEDNKQLYYIERECRLPNSNAPTSDM